MQFRGTQIEFVLKALQFGALLIHREETASQLFGLLCYGTLTLRQPTRPSIEMQAELHQSIAFTNQIFMRHLQRTTFCFRIAQNNIGGILTFYGTCFEFP